MAKKLYDKPLVSNRNGSAELYTWQPYDTEKKVNERNVNSIDGVGCNLFEDNNVSYTYEILFVNGANKRIPYVVCDYVE